MYWAAGEVLLLLEDRLPLVVHADHSLDWGGWPVPDPVSEVLLGNENGDRGVALSDCHIGVVIQPEFGKHLGRVILAGMVDYLGITQVVLCTHLVELPEIGLLLPTKGLFMELPGESNYSFINGREVKNYLVRLPQDHGRSPFRSTSSKQGELCSLS